MATLRRRWSQHVVCPVAALFDWCNFGHLRFKPSAYESRFGENDFWHRTQLARRKGVSVHSSQSWQCHKAKQGVKATCQEKVVDTFWVFLLLHTHLWKNLVDSVVFDNGDQSCKKYWDLPSFSSFSWIAAYESGRVAWLKRIKWTCWPTWQ